MSTRTYGALAALLLSACGGARGEVTAAVDEQRGDSCALARPDFGGPASPAERAVFAYDADAPLNLKRTLEATTNGVERSVVAFDSPDGGSVTGLLFDPVTRSSARPGIVLMHGAPGNARVMAGQGQDLAEHGAVVLAIDAPFARRGGSWLQFTERDRAEQIQLVKDLQRAVDVLRARPDVDAARIAYVGVSFGGAMGALFAGVERRLRGAVLVVGDGGLVSHFTGVEDRSFLASLSCATRATWFRAMVPVEPIRFIPHASPTELLLQSGRADELVPVSDAETLHAAAPEPKTLRWYDAGHGLNVQALGDRYAWLHARIGLDLLAP